MKEANSLSLMITVIDRRYLTLSLTPVRLRFAIRKKLNETEMMVTAFLIEEQQKRAVVSYEQSEFAKTSVIK